MKSHLYFYTEIGHFIDFYCKMIKHSFNGVVQVCIAATCRELGKKHGLHGILWPWTSITRSSVSDVSNSYHQL
jgi:hypothetical protein